MDLIRPLIVISGIGAAALLFGMTSEEQPPTDEMELRAWQAPPGEPYWKESSDEKLGPYAPSWPTWAVVCKYAPHVRGSEKLAGSPDSTLFLMAAPDLRKPNLIPSIPYFSRFATACRGDAQGCWIRLAAPHAEPLFVLYEASGGNSGDTIRIFVHRVAYESPFVGSDAFQNHTFEQVYLRSCVIAPLVGDIDGDGCDELLVKEVVSTGPSNAESKWGYRIIKYKNGKFELRGDIDDVEVEKFKKLREFESKPQRP